MDGYPMPVADLLVDAAAGHKVISFMDGNAGYNQIFMAIEDISKTAFRCPGHIGLFEWIVMTFGLKNAGATYQRVIYYIFHELIGKIVEIYIDDVVIKSLNHDSHLKDVKRTLGRVCAPGPSARLRPPRAGSCVCDLRPTKEPGCHGASGLLSHGSRDTPKSVVAGEPGRARRDDDATSPSWQVRSPPRSSPLSSAHTRAAAPAFLVLASSGGCTLLSPRRRPR
jgi:hypothetical protein